MENPLGEAWDINNGGLNLRNIPNQSIDDPSRIFSRAGPSRPMAPPVPPRVYGSTNTYNTGLGGYGNSFGYGQSYGYGGMGGGMYGMGGGMFGRGPMYGAGAYGYGGNMLGNTGMGGGDVENRYV